MEVILLINNFPDNYRLIASPDDYEKQLNLEDRRLYLTQEIRAFDADRMIGDMSLCSYLVDVILAYNREDKGIAPEDRKPIRLYINSPGGDATEGFSLISAIKLSKTPIYTINVGVWYSMAFLIGITGHKRFSLPCSTFLMHDGHNLVWGSGSKAQGKMDFGKRFELEVVKKHILEHSNMKSTEFDSLFCAKHYMLPEDALERNFIDEIVTDIDTIL